MALKTRKWGWLVAAVLLLALGAWLMLSGDAEIAPDPVMVSIPKRQTTREQVRALERRTVTYEALPSDAGAEVVPPVRKRVDPLLSLMPTEIKSVAMVAEFNAIVNSDLGGPMLDCLSSGATGPVQWLRDAGLDPQTTFDRLAFVDGVAVVTGNFPPGAWTRQLPADSVGVDYGPHAKLYERPAKSHVVATWGNSMVLFGERDDVKAALDRLAAGPGEESAILDEDDAYGELYGVVGAGLIEDMFGDDDQLSRTIRNATDHVHLHLDVSHDVGLAADIEGTDDATTEELRRALGGALSLGRMEAQAGGHPEEVQLFDAARVREAKEGSFRLEAGLPYEFVKKAFERCVERNNRRRDAGIADDTDE